MVWFLKRPSPIDIVARAGGCDMPTALLDISEDLLCHLFVGRVLDGRRVCKTLRDALFKAGSVDSRLKLHVLSPVEDWRFLRRFHHVQVLVGTDDGLRESAKAGICATRVLGYADIENAVELDHLKSRSMNRNVWRAARMVTHGPIQVLPPLHVLHKLLNALDRCEHVERFVCYWLTRRLLMYKHRPDVFNLGLRLRLIFPTSRAHDLRLLHSMSSPESVRAIIHNYSTRNASFQCSAMTLIDLVMHALNARMTYDSLVPTGCLRAVIGMAHGHNEPRVEISLCSGDQIIYHSRAGAVWYRDIRHCALVAIMRFIRQCEDDQVVQALLDANIIAVAQAAAGSGDLFFSVPSCMLLFTMCKFPAMCAAMLRAHVHETLVWMCRNNMPQAIVILSRLLNAVPVLDESGTYNPQFTRVLQMYTDTILWMQHNACHHNYLVWFAHQNEFPDELQAFV